MNRFLATMACVCAVMGFSVPAFGQETVHFQENFSGDDLDFSYDDGSGWVTRNWYDASDYMVSDGKLYLGPYGYADSDYLNIIGTPSEMTFSGTWGSTGRALGMYIYDDNSGNGLDINYSYQDNGSGNRRFLSINDGLNEVSIARSLVTPESNFSLHFDSAGWSFTEGKQTWSFEGNPFNAGSLGAMYFGLYANGDDPDYSGDAELTGYFSNLKLTSPAVTPEPLSAGLFLLGGGVLAVIRRKKA